MHLFAYVGIQWVSQPEACAESLAKNYRFKSACMTQETLCFWFLMNQLRLLSGFCLWKMPRCFKFSVWFQTQIKFYLSWCISVISPLGAATYILLTTQQQRRCRCKSRHISVCVFWGCIVGVDKKLWRVIPNQSTSAGSRKNQERLWSRSGWSEQHVC